LEDESDLNPFQLACKNGFDQLGFCFLDKVSSEKLIVANHNNYYLHLLCKNKEEKLGLVSKILEKLRKDSTREKNYLDEALLSLDMNKQTVLNIAIDNNHLNIVELLLKDYYKEKVLVEDKNGNMPIHYAAKCGSTEILKVIVKCNGFTIRTNSNGENALHIAASNNKFKFIRDFIINERKCEEKKMGAKDYVPCVRVCNKNNLQPMFLAVIGGHQKCVEILTQSEDLVMDGLDKSGNTIYHVCAEFNNFDSLRFLLSRKDPMFLEPLYIENNNKDNVIQIASYFGHLEIIKLVIAKIYDGLTSAETYLLSKNKDGRTFFHIACIKGHFNVVEYFLKDLKLHYLLEYHDNEMNTSLHLASQNGHLSIVEVLLEYGANINARNKEGNTALEISCRKGYFEISKVLINNYTSISIQDDVDQRAQNDHPLHVACHEGAHEVVKLLLLKGATIDIINSQDQNCLDIAIRQGHRDVIRVLLEDKNWYKLIDTYDENKQNVAAIAGLFSHQARAVPNTKRFQKENPQLLALYENKMWDMIKIVLDNCKLSENNFEFSKIDPPYKKVAKHPLMLIARSGQESLLKHETVAILLKLKWRYLPRFFFYSNLIYYFFFLILFSIYSVSLSNIRVTANPLEMNDTNHVENSTDIYETINLINSNFTLYDYDDERHELPQIMPEMSIDTRLEFVLLIILLISMVKKIVQMILVDGLSFIASIENWLELFTYVITYMTLLSRDLNSKLTYCSIAILSSFVVFSFLIQKLRVFGLYVLAFRRTLQNSAKFFPIFIMIYVGFNLSFRLRTHFGVSYYNTTGTASVIKTLTMVIGELDSSQMGLEERSIINYIIYFLFISIMSVIILNLFVGIAVGEINTVLDEADIQQISMRIIFVLKVQQALRYFTKHPFLKKYIDLRFRKYNLENESKLFKTLIKTITFLRTKFSSIEPSIKLVDPTKRLEDSIMEVSKSTNDDLKMMKESFFKQLNDVESKLCNSQQRLEDCLLEMSRKTLNNFETTKEDSSNQIGSIESKLFGSQNQIKMQLADINRAMNMKFDSLKQSIASKMDILKTTFTQSHTQILAEFVNMMKVNHQAFQQTNQRFDHISTSFVPMRFQLNNYQSDFDKIYARFDDLNKIQETILKNQEEERKLREKKFTTIDVQCEEKELEPLIQTVGEETQTEENEQQIVQDEPLNQSSTTDQEVESEPTNVAPNQRVSGQFSDANIDSEIEK
jgi:ankyrin repeat protein